ncbi:MAG: translocation/assembly module TamB domain-containing protein [Ottowia sp.]|nr:translocation/assembly module TamB domain-containing protein [Ottowia sp.]
MAKQRQPTTAAAHRPRHGAPRILAWLLLALVLLLALAAGGLIAWAGSDGSLATALRLAGDHLPLTSRNASGAILGGGKIESLVWDQDGVRVEVDDAELDWRPRDLLRRRLHVVRLTATRIVMDDQGQPRADKTPSFSLPDALALPFGLRLDIDELRVGEIRLQGLPERRLHDIHANYHYDGSRHALELLSAHYKDDDYQATLQAQVTVGARAPMPVSAQLSGAAAAQLPDANSPVLAALQANVGGTLHNIQAQLRLQGAPGTAGHEALQMPPLPTADASLQTEDNLGWPVASNAAPLRLDARAQVTPNDALPLQEVHAELHTLDLSAFLPEAPSTDLVARINVTPSAPGSANGDMGLTLHATVVNDKAGPWDAGQLPVNRLTATASWQDGVATVERLLLELAGGSIKTTGQWRTTGSSSDAGAVAGQWQAESHIAHINPALLHSQLAAFPLDGTITATGMGGAADFDLALNAVDTTASAETGQDTDAADAAGESEALAAQLRALALRQVRASGRFADGLLALDRLLVQADDARLDGSASVNLADPGQLTIDSDIGLDVPGLKLSVQTTELAADGGAGKAALNLSDAAATLQWAKKLPGAGDALAGAQASGSGKLDASWEGGWLQPVLQAKLDVPRLDLTPPTQGGKIDTVQVRELDATVSGSLEQAKLALRGRVLQPAQGVDMQLALDTEGGWANQVLTLDKLQLRAGDASASGHVTLDLSDALGANADLQVRAPGLAAAIKGELAPKTGAGTVQIDLGDAAATLRWAKTLPGAARVLAGASATGTARLDARWQGGTANPHVNATLGVPRLDYVASKDANSLSVRDLQAELAGDLAQAALTANGHIVQGARKLNLRLAIDGGRARDDSAAWRLRISELAAQLELPELGHGQWQVASRDQVSINWNPANGGQLDVAAGVLTITSPAPSSQSRIIWEPVRLRDGQLHSAGRITELPLQWVRRVAGRQLEDAGISGDIVLGGQWDIQMGRELKFNALLERKSGDIKVTTGNSAGTAIPVGLRQARVELSNSGNDVTVDIRWDSERAGIVDGQFNTQLTSTRGADGQARWSWSDQAPVKGRLKANLPEISVWSLLAPPGWRLHGSLGADIQVAGSVAAPQMTGTLTADNLAMRSVVEGLQFENGRLRAHAQGTRLIIDEFVLHGAGEDGGSIHATGEAGLINGEPAARMQAVVDKLHASVREDREIIASGRIVAAFKNQTVSAKGTLVVDRARIVLPDESRPSLGSDVFIHGLDPEDRAAVEQARKPGADDEAAQASAGARDAAEASPLHADIDIKINMGDDFQLQGMGIDTRLAGELALTADGSLAQMPTLNGRVETVGGTYRAYGQHLSIEHGRVFFTGDASNPGLDILALRPNYISDQKVGALIQGTALLPQVTLYSRPTLPDDQVLAWLVLGHAAPEDGGEAAMMQTAALALLGGRDSEGLASSFGLDELSFGNSSNGEGLAGASVTLGKRLSDRLYTAYEHSLSGTGGVLMIFYELSRRWVLRGQASESSAIDLIYRLSYD